MKHAAVPFALVFALALAQYPALADWPTDPNVNVPVCTATGSQGPARITSDGSGGAIVGWFDDRSSDVYVQRVTSAGVTAWQADGVPACAAHAYNSRDKLAIVPDGAGGAILAWEEKRNLTDAIYAQRVSSAGVAVWGTNGVRLSETLPLEMVLASDGAGGAIVVWTTGFDDYIHAQRVRSTGATAWVDIVSTGGNPTVLSDSSGGAYVGWRSVNGEDAYVQHITASGAIAWTAGGVPMHRTPPATLQTTADLASDGSGGLFVTWVDLGLASSNPDVYVQHVLATGVVDPAWPATGLGIAVLPGHQEGPRIVADGAGGAVVVWVDERGGGAELYAQRVTAGGAILWAANGIPVRGTPGQEVDIAACRTTAGDVFVTWTDLTQRHILAQRLSLAGERAWPGGSPVATAIGGQWGPVVCPDDSGGAIVAWNDKRAGSQWHIYAQRVPVQGLPVVPTTPVLPCGRAATWTAGQTTLVDGFITSTTVAGAMHAYSFTNTRHWPGEVSVDSVYVPAGETVTIPLSLVVPDTAADGEVDMTFTAWPRSVPSAVDTCITPAYDQANLGVMPFAAGRLAIRAVRVEAAGSIVRITLAATPGDVVVVDVFDVTGRRCVRARVAAGSGAVTVTPVRALASGVYLVRAAQAGSSATARFVVTR